MLWGKLLLLVDYKYKRGNNVYFKHRIKHVDSVPLLHKDVVALVNINLK